MKARKAARLPSCARARAFARVFAFVLAVALSLVLALPLSAEPASPKGATAASGTTAMPATGKAVSPAAAGKAPAASVFSAFPSGVSGDYVVYRDYTWEKPTWIGFLYYNETTYGAFVITPETGANVSLLFSAEILDGKMVLTGQNIISRITQDDVLGVNYIMRLLPDLYSWRMGPDSAAFTVNAPTVTTGAVAGKAAVRSSLLPSLVTQKRNLPSFGGDVSLVFAPEIPVFGLRGITSAAGKASLELARMGRVQSGGDKEFFAFKPMGAVKAGTVLSVPASRKSESKTVDGVKLNLDGQWTMVADNTFFLGDAAVIIVDTLDLSLMQIPRENLPLSLVRLFSLSSQSSWTTPSELSVSGSAKKFRIVNLMYDVESGSLHRDIKACIPGADGKTCAIVSLSVSETAYGANAAYFDSLF